MRRVEIEKWLDRTPNVDPLLFLVGITSLYEELIKKFDSLNQCQLESC